MNAIKFIQENGIEKAREVVESAPTFIRKSISQGETMYNPRTEKYIERGPQSVMIQLDGEDDCYHSTMPYSSSFYDECLLFSELKRLVESIDLVNGWNGIERTKQAYADSPFKRDKYMQRVKQAIADYKAIYLAGDLSMSYTYTCLGGPSHGEKITVNYELRCGDSIHISIRPSINTTDFFNFDSVAPCRAITEEIARYRAEIFRWDRVKYIYLVHSKVTMPEALELFKERF